MHLKKKNVLNKDRHFPVWWQPHKNCNKKGGQLTSLLSRSYLNLSPERSGSKPRLCTDTQKQALNHECGPTLCQLLAQQQRLQADMTWGEWSWTYLFTSKPVNLFCSLPTPYIPLIRCILYDALLCPQHNLGFDYKNKEVMKQASTKLCQSHHTVCCITSL